MRVSVSNSPKSGLTIKIFEHLGGPKQPLPARADPVGAAPKNPARRLIGMSPSSRSPLSDPSFGLAWSNRLAPNDLLVRAAIKHGAFHLLFEAVLAHGLEFVEQQLAIMQLDEDAALSDRALAEVRRKLANIGLGVSAAELAAQEVTHPETGRPGTWPGPCEGEK